MRIRTIKPEFWSHPIMGRLEDSAKCLAIALLNYADDEGYFLADPALVRSSCRPFDDSSLITQGLLRDLSTAGWIQIQHSPVMGDIGRVVNFKEHQAINKVKPSKLKRYFDLEKDSGPLPAASPVNPIPVPDISGTIPGGVRDEYGSSTGGVPQGTGNREQGKEQGRKTTTTREEETFPEAESGPEEPMSLSEALGWYCKAFAIQLPSQVNAINRERLRALVSQYPRGKLEEAFRATANGNGKTMDYLAAVLKGEPSHVKRKKSRTHQPGDSPACQGPVDWAGDLPTLSSAGLPSYAREQPGREPA